MQSSAIERCKEESGQRRQPNPSQRHGIGTSGRRSKAFSREVRIKNAERREQEQRRKSDRERPKVRRRPLSREAHEAAPNDGRNEQPAADSRGYGRIRLCQRHDLDYANYLFLSIKTW